MPASSSSSRVQPPVSTETLIAPGGQRALDVVDVVADVDRGALAAQHVGLADAPDPALEVVDVEPEVVEVELGVGGVLAGDDHDPAAVPAYGGERLGGARRTRRGRDRVVGVERPEPVDRRADRVGGEVRREHQVERRAEPGRHLLDGELHAELGAERPARRAKPGAVSISVMSRSKPTTSGASVGAAAWSQPKEPL